MAKKHPMVEKMNALLAADPHMPPCKRFRHFSNEEFLEYCKVKIDRLTAAKITGRDEIRKMLQLQCGELRKRGLTCPGIPE